MSTIDTIKERLNIVDVITDSGVELRKTGRSFSGFCPFHSNTHTPAFTVYPDTQSFYCFGCHASGSVFDYVMRKENLEFRDALRMLAARAGVTLTERTDQDQHIDQQRTRLLAINTIAARYFAYVLLQQKQGDDGRCYLAARGISPETIEAFQLGMSRSEWEHLYTYLTQKKGYTPDEIAAAGLAITREQGGHYDRFRHRIMFPIHTMKGDVVGFGGRAIADEQPKYLNTPQTVLFDKSHVLYGLHHAREAIRQHDACVIVEGYLDVLTAHQYGFRNVVAPLGTALTAGHVALVRRLTQHVYLALDADAAGQKAMLRGINTVQQMHEDTAPDDTWHPVVTAQGFVRWQNDVSLHMLVLPQGKDPDNVIRENPQQWRDLLATAMPVVDFYFAAYTADLDLTQPQQQRLALERLLPIVAQLDATQQRVYIVQLEHLVGMKAELLLDMVRDQRHTTPSASRRQTAAPIAATTATAPAPRTQQRETLPPPRYELVSRGYRAPMPLTDEEFLLALMLRYPNTCDIMEDTIRKDLAQFPLVRQLLGTEIENLFATTAHRIIWQHWVNAGSPTVPQATHALQATHIASFIEWAHDLDETLVAHLERLVTQPLPQPTEHAHLVAAETSARYIRIKQVRLWQHRISQQLSVDTDMTTAVAMDAYLTHVNTLTELAAYKSFLTNPPHNKGYTKDLRVMLENER